ncbi:MAG TPA: alpha/beta hydrolase [Longimicrobiales bacterium]
MKRIVVVAFALAACGPASTREPAPVVIAPPDTASSVADSLVVDGVTLRATMLTPAPVTCPAPWPVALIHAGSGPTDRNGNGPLMGGDNNSLRMLAEGLAHRCIASLRYDKRGIGASVAFGMREQDLRFQTFAGDAAAWLRRLQGDARFGDVVVIGHSEGAALVTLAAREVPVSGAVLIAGAGRPAGEILREQLQRGLPPQLYAEADSALTSLEAGRTIENPPPELFALLRPSIQPYLISWLPVDPAAELAALDVPALVVWGTTDAQVARADAERLAAADDDVRLVVVEGMNHVLKVVPADDPVAQRASYGDPTLPLAPELLPAIASFIHEL